MLVALVVIFGAIFLIYRQMQQKNPEQKIKINEHEITVELVQTQKARENGLSKRNSLNENHGMLFIFEPSSYPQMWMREMNFPIDIIWINKNYEIVYIKKQALPCPRNQNLCTLYTPGKPAQYVLEITSGDCDKYNIKVGDIVEMNL